MDSDIQTNKSYCNSIKKYFCKFFSINQFRWFWRINKCFAIWTHVADKYGGWEGYFKHQKEDPCLRSDGTPWPKASPEAMAALLAKPIRTLKDIARDLPPELMVGVQL
jgi:hypothetical protein